MRQKQIQHQEPTKIDLKIDLRNFGPIASGSIRVKPLTVFIGPNSSGKSYAAMLIHSILSSGRLQRYSMRGLEPTSNITDLLDAIMEAEETAGRLDISPNTTKKITTSLVQEYARRLEMEICRNFGIAKPSELVRIGSRSARMLVSGRSKFSISLGSKFDFKIAPQQPAKYVIETGTSGTDPHGAATGMRDGRTVISVNGTRNHARFTAARRMLDHICGRIVPHVEGLRSYYLPSSRSGILQGHKALSAAIVKHSSFGGMESFEIPRLSGAVADFMSEIITARGRRGHYYDLASRMESEILGGIIKIPSQKEMFSEITYETNNVEIPLHRASSTITEIAPISLYLKHVIPSHSLLIIEEPESHLHPQNQIVMARYIAGMIRAGLQVLVTTHSPSLLERLGQFALADSIPSMTRRNEVFEGSDYLDTEEVAAHIFLKKADGSHVIEQLETNSDVGIVQDEFIKSTEWLHDKYVRIMQGRQDD